MLSPVDPVWAAVYAPNGTVLVAGQTAYRPTYAQTLEAIAKKGPDAFYEGPIAQATVAAAKAKGGILSLADLKGEEYSERRLLLKCFTLLLIIVIGMVVVHLQVIRQSSEIPPISTIGDIKSRRPLRLHLVLSSSRH